VTGIVCATIVLMNAVLLHPNSESSSDILSRRTSIILSNHVVL
jgi:hypothetical protein